MINILLCVGGFVALWWVVRLLVWLVALYQRWEEHRWHYTEDD